MRSLPQAATGTRPAHRLSQAKGENATPKKNCTRLAPGKTTPEGISKKRPAALAPASPPPRATSGRMREGSPPVLLIQLMTQPAFPPPLRRSGRGTLLSLAFCQRSTTGGLQGHPTPAVPLAGRRDCAPDRDLAGRLRMQWKLDDYMTVSPS